MSVTRPQPRFGYRPEREHCIGARVRYAPSEHASGVEGVWLDLDEGTIVDGPMVEMFDVKGWFVCYADHGTLASPGDCQWISQATFLIGGVWFYAACVLAFSAVTGLIAEHS